jgi:hypothetical protein
MAEIARTTIPSSNGFCHNRQCALPRVKRNRLFMAASHSVYSLYVNTRKARRSPTVCHDVRVGSLADISHCNSYVRPGSLTAHLGCLAPTQRSNGHYPIKEFE